MVLLLALATVGLAPAMPAHAGGWAVTLLDPLPDRLEADRAYTVGYWVLQHGSHPFDGELGRTGLRLVGADRELEFTGQPLPEAAHYAVSFAVPAGTWRVYALQGWFEQFEVGTLTVPGGLELRPSEMAVNVGGHSDGGEAPHWGAVHPPAGIGDGHSGDGHSGEVRSVREQPAAAAPRPAAALRADTTPQPRSAVALLVLAACAVVALLATGLGRPLRQRLRG
jgi:hypothetical protein